MKVKFLDLSIFFIIFILLFFTFFLYAENKKQKNVIIVTFQLDKNFKIVPYYYDSEWRKYKKIDFLKKIELFKNQEERWDFERAMDEYKKYLQKCHNKKIK